MVRVRFAPSPTGDLHVGGLRTALYNWLYARRHGGVFILRIEDTDEARNKDESTRAILEGMAWIGLTADEGPFYQSERMDLYRAKAKELLASGGAYRCWCTKEHLEERRKAAEQEKRPFRYERTCRGRAEGPSPGAPFVLRAALPADGKVVVDDRILGEVVTDNRELDDFVIARADGSPVYNFCVVVDDIDMRVTHVIRGVDHLANTPKQIHLYDLLGAPKPVFAHIPMVHGMDGKKLSKRHGATAVGDYQHQGILPLAMRNFLALLGWSPGGDREIIPEAEMIRLFSLEGIQRKAAVFDVTKLEWMNGQYLSAVPTGDLVAPVARHLAEMGVQPGSRDIRPAIDAVKARSRTLLDVATQVAVRLDRTRVVRDAKGEALAAKLGDSFRVNLAAAGTALGSLAAAEWTASNLEAAIKALAEREGKKLGDLMQPVRVALTGGTVSEPVNELLAVVGRDESLARIEAAAK